MPFLVEASPRDFLLVLQRPKRDFGITAAVIASIAIGSAAVAAAAIVLTTSGETAATVNSIVSQTTEALQTQKAVNAHLKEGLMLLNQRIDILQEEIDMVYQLHNVICQPSHKAVCVTASPFSRLQNISHNLSEYLQGPWNAKFVNFSYELTKQILRINDTRVKIIPW